MAQKKVKKTPKKEAKKAVKKSVPSVQEMEENTVKKIKIRVVGIGGGAGNIVAEISRRIPKASFYIADTDFKSLKWLPSGPGKVQFGQSFTGGLGTGMRPDVAEEAAKSEKEKMAKLFENQDLVILVACLGGGVGSGASHVLAKISKSFGNITYGIFTLPFKFEGERKMAIAQEALDKIRENVNAYSVIPNERIFQIIEKNTPLKEALSKINKILADAIEGLIEIVYGPGLINIDFADLKTVFEGTGKLTYLSSTEIEKKEEKEPIEKVITSPLYPYGIDGARAVMFNIAGPKDLSLSQVNQISKAISQLSHPEARIIFGISKSDSESKIKVILLATGCSRKILSDEGPKLPKPKSKSRPKKKKVKKTKSPEKSEKQAKPRTDIFPLNLLQPKPKEEENKNPPAAAALSSLKTKIRRNAIQIRKEFEREEAEMLEKEKFWETPSFLRRKLIKD